MELNEVKTEVMDWNDVKVAYDLDSEISESNELIFPEEINIKNEFEDIPINGNDDVQLSSNIICKDEHNEFPETDATWDAYEGSEDDLSVDESYSNTDESDVEELIQFDEWKVVPNICDDERDSQIYETTFPYAFHPAIDMNCLTIRSCFETFVSPKIVDFVCQWTNERAEMFLEANGNLALKIYGLYWKCVLRDEMYTFISLVLMMGLVRLPKMHDYWRKSYLLGGPPVFSAEIMSRDRFLSILKFLRFSSPRAVNRTNPTTWLEMFFAHIRENTTLLLDPGKIVAVDECLMLYKGQLHFKQHIKSTRSRFGIKLFCLCPSDPKFRGYTYNLGLYSGKDIYSVSHILGAEILSKPERIVVYLMQNLLAEGREVILDSCCLSVRLAEFLLSKNTYVTGTINVTRVPRELSEVPLQKYQSCFIRNKDRLIVRFRDKQDVYVLTTKLTANFQEKQKHDTFKKSEGCKKPQHIEHYNVSMASVDIADQDIKPFNAARKNYNWFKKLGIHVIQRMVLNAKVLYENGNSKKVLFSTFTERLCDELLEHYKPKYAELRERYNSKKIKSNFKTSSTLHRLIRLPNTEQKRRRCWICYNAYKRTKSTYLFCSGCDKPLCCDEHFQEYHKK